MRTAIFLIAIGLIFTACNNTSDTTEETTTELKNSDIVRAWNTAFMSGNQEEANQYLADDFEFSGPVPEPLGKEAYAGMMKSMKNAFPDLSNSLNILGETDDAVVGTLQMAGTHSGDFDLTAMNMGVIPATGKSFKLPVEKFKINLQDGKVTKFHVDVPEDGGVAGIMTQLGIEMAEK